jgi:hypothetical protein
MTAIMSDTCFRSAYLTLDDAIHSAVAVRERKTGQTCRCEPAYARYKRNILNAIESGELSVPSWNSSIDRGRHLFIDTNDFYKWLIRKGWHQVPPDSSSHSQIDLATPRTSNGHVGAKECLVAAMRASPDQNPKTKNIWKQQIADEYGIGSRAFDRLWDRCISESGAHAWSLPGRPRKHKSP